MPMLALRLVSAAIALTEAAGAVLRSDVESRLDRVQAAEKTLSVEVRKAAWTAGRAMNLEQVVAEAQRGGTRGPPSADGGPRRAPATDGEPQPDQGDRPPPAPSCW
jgi:hypothetical protein